MVLPHVFSNPVVRLRMRTGLILKRFVSKSKPDTQDLVSKENFS